MNDSITQKDSQVLPSTGESLESTNANKLIQTAKSPSAVEINIGTWNLFDQSDWFKTDVL